MTTTKVKADAIFEKHFNGYDRMTNIYFDKQLGGYDKAQVDSYIDNIAKAYQNAYEEYTAKCAEYDELLEKYTQLEALEESRPNADVIAKALLDSEIMAKKIVTEAQAEAEKIREDSYIEKAAMMLQAQRVVNDANTEAAKIGILASKNLEETNETILKAISGMQNLLGTCA